MPNTLQLFAITFNTHLGAVNFMGMIYIFIHISLKSTKLKKKNVLDFMTYNVQVVEKVIFIFLFLCVALVFIVLPMTKSEFNKNVKHSRKSANGTKNQTIIKMKMEYTVKKARYSFPVSLWFDCNFH